ncbi:hypothetical protein [Runella sp. SP2]|uniref:hypothetical protein n=1 Tax=Runella sp. SP2 TaxID=2268026 RepID=UPI000F0959F0|nr:hypothetical protein [Runella sp. SP2]AYQ36600.1 hypothetical protein DTQ70_30225 [Runella sp. SP2]
MRNVSVLVLFLLKFHFLMAQSSRFQFSFDGKSKGVSNTGWQVNKGDIVSITASGEINVGIFAKGRTPDGIPNYNGNRYNLLPSKPHCALMVCVINQTGLNKPKENWGWEVIGSCGYFVAPQAGVLVFDLNETDNWRWDNEAINGGWAIKFTVAKNMPASSNNPKLGLLGKLKDSPVLRTSNNEVVYDCRSFSKGSDKTWKITDENGGAIGLCVEDAPYVYEFVGGNSLSKTNDRNVYLDTKQQKTVFYKGRKHELAPNDQRWYLLDDKSICEGIFEIKDGEYLVNSNQSDNKKSFSEILQHINRNSLNREAKGRLTYLCSQTYKVVLDYRYYTDETGSIWMLNQEIESGFHKNPNNTSQVALKFTRKNPQNLTASFESIRIPLSSNDRKPFTVDGSSYPYKLSLDGKQQQSINLMDTEYRGSYNFVASTFSAINYGDHKSLDMVLHEYYKDYIIFPEKFGSPSQAEIMSRKVALSIPLKNGERTCPWKDPWN